MRLMMPKTLVVSISAVVAMGLLAGCANRPPAAAHAAAAQVTAAQGMVITPNALAVDGNGNVYLADAAHEVIDEFAPNGRKLPLVAGVSGNGGPIVPGPATSSTLSNPSGLAVDGAGNVFVADSGDSQVVGEVSATSHELSVVAGVLGEKGPLSPGPAVSSDLGSPSQVAVDSAGDLFIADTVHGTVDEVDPAGTLSIVAGIPGSFRAPTPGPATSSALYAPTGVAVDSAGDVYIADVGNSVVEKVDPSGTLSIFAGTPGSTGIPEPGPATDTTLGSPTGLAVDASGDVFIADPSNGVVEEVTPDGTLSIVAGEPGTSGPPTPGPATASALDEPSEVAVDAAGDLYIADTGNNLVERVTGGNLTTFAGNGKSTAMLRIQTLAGAAITARLHTIQLLLPAVNASTGLTADDKAAALALLDQDQSTLLSLGQQLAGDLSTVQARSDYNAVFLTLRIYALAVQQVYLAGAADDLLYGSLTPMTSAYSDLQNLLGGPDASQNTPQIKAAMKDLAAQIAKIRTSTTGLAAAVLAFTPSQSNADPHVLQPARQSIAVANRAVTKGNADITTVSQALGAGLAGSAGKSTAASGLATRDVHAANRAQSVPDQPAKITGA